MRKARRTVVAVVLTVVFGIFSIPALIFGLYLLACSLRIHSTAIYYVEYPYLLATLFFVSVAGLGLACTWYGAWHRSFLGTLFVVPIVMGLAILVYPPEGWPHLQSMSGDSNYMSNTGAFLGSWYEVYRSFPKDEDEFRQAMKDGPPAWQFRLDPVPALSPYSQGSHRIPYQIVIVTNASGPRLDNVSTRPGVVYYCVSTDRQQYWLTITGLQKDVSAKVDLKRLIDRPNEKILIFTKSGSDYSVGSR